MSAGNSSENLALDKSASRIQGMFATIAHKYDFLNHTLSFHIDRYWRWRTTRLAPLPSDGSAVLDTCTGTGDLALAYFRLAKGRNSLVGTDFCIPMLEHACRKKRGGPGPAFLAADTLRLPFPAACFGLVTVAFGLRNVSDTAGGLRELARVCKPGGMVAVLEFSSPRLWPFSWIYRFYFRNILPRIGQWVSRSNDFAYGYLPASVASFPERQALASLLEAAGLREVRYHPLTLGVATLYLGRKPGV
ncbi:MAG: ubiquinone/menaquinone biosynthesis methyltransferase [Planctomycetota bacterium]|nr:ubiquinone/menaquinone biosynthesis methyltransferase [Planctomycetota bacterium]